MIKFDLYPSIDIIGGKALTSKTAVQNILGVSSDKKIIGHPKEVAQTYKESGAQWLHIVDLDAAAGIGCNKEIILDLIKSIDIKVQVCGGINNDQILNRLFDAGCDRVNIGSAALNNPTWCESLFKKYDDFIAISLDVKKSGDQYHLATRGWNDIKGDLWSTLSWLDSEGCTRYVVTDIDKAGMMNSPNIELLKAVMLKTDKPIVTAAGVSNLSDIRNLINLGVEGTILGQVLHTGAMCLSDALKEVTA